MNKLLSYLFFTTLFSVFIVSFVSAQVDLPAELSSFTESSNQLLQVSPTIELTPENPSPNDIVNAKVSFKGDTVNMSEIGWYIDGKLIKSGVGLKNFSFRTGNSGQKIELRVVIKTENGIFENTISFAPLGITLIYEPRVFTPPFYKGKGLPAHQSAIRILAIPEGVGSGTNDFVYKWTLNSKVLDTESGLGKNYVDIIGDRPWRSIDLALHVESAKNQFVADKYFNLETIEPEILVYKNDPQYGILFNRAVLPGEIFTGKEITLNAFPFSYSTTKTGLGLTYEWMMNGMSNIGASKQILITNKNEEVGSAQLSLKISNYNKIFQTSTNNFLIRFEKSQ